MIENPRVVILGGGGGASVVARGFADNMPEADLLVANPVSDSGGSSGYFANKFDLVPVGDPRSNLEAVSIHPSVGAFLGKDSRFGADATVDDVADWGDRMVATVGRYGLDERLAKEGRDVAVRMARMMDSLKGHPYGNILLAGYAVLEYDKSVVESSRRVGEMVGARARVMPVANERLQLVMNDSGRIILGEDAIDDHEVQDAHGAFVHLKSPHGTHVSIHPEAAKAIENADLVVIPPGSKHTTTAAVLSVPGVANALFTQSESGGQVVAVANLIEDRASRGNCVGALANSIQRYMGGRTLDAIFYNSNVDASAFPEGSVPTAFDPAYLRLMNVPAIGADLVGGKAEHGANDAIAALRSEIEHNPEAVVRAIRSYVESQMPAQQGSRELIPA